jgi:glycosyltransferase 2 family protein
MTLKKITWRRAIGWLLALVILFFLVRTLWATWDEVAQSGFTFEFNLPLLIFSTFLLVPGRSFAVEAWRRILRALGNPISFRFALYAWFVSNLARFIPGNVFQLAAMMFLTESAGVSKLNVVLSQAVYAAIALSVAALYGLTLLPIPPQYAPLIAIAFIALIILFALPAVFQLMLRVSSRLLQLVRRNPNLVAPSGAAMTFRQGLVPPLFSFCMWTINGIAFWLFVRSITEISPTAIPAFIGMNAAAYFVGYASFITPSGLGFREATLAFLLGAYFPAPVAVAIAFLTRLWSMAGEFLGVGIAVWWKPANDQRPTTVDQRLATNDAEQHSSQVERSALYPPDATSPTTLNAHEMRDDVSQSK